MASSRPSEFARLFKASRNSLAGLAHAFNREPAFRLEAALLVTAIPVAWAITSSFSSLIWLVGAVAAVLVAELLNTAVEQVCNAVSRDYREEIRIAKDCASAAVLLTSVICGAIWLGAVLDFISG